MHSCNMFCGDSSWSLYKDSKCVKLVDQYVSFEEAKNLCLYFPGVLESDPIITIKSPEEQEAITRFLFSDSSLLDNVWLGARRKTNSGSTSEFEWTDGSPIEFSNWSPGSPTNDTEKACAQLSSHLSREADSKASSKVNLNEDGLWSDVSCAKKNLVLCQKPQTWSLLQLQKTIIQQREELKQTKENLEKVQANPGRIFNFYMQGSKNFTDHCMF